MRTLQLNSVISEDEVSEIERISEENAKQISMNRRIALTILAYDRERLQESVAADPETYRQLVNSLEACMENLKTQIRILEYAEKRLIAPLADHAGINSTLH